MPAQSGDAEDDGDCNGLADPGTGVAVAAGELGEADAAAVECPLDEVPQPAASSAVPASAAATHLPAITDITLITVTRTLQVGAWLVSARPGLVYGATGPSAACRPGVSNQEIS